MNPDRALITDKVCGVRVWDLLIRDIRYLGKLVDELPKGPLWSRFSGKTSMSRSFWPFRNSGCFRLESPLLCRREGAAFSDALAVSGTVRADGHAVLHLHPQVLPDKVHGSLDGQPGIPFAAPGATHLADAIQARAVIWLLNPQGSRARGVDAWRWPGTAPR